MRLLLALFPLLLWAQQDTGSIRGQVRYDLPPEHVHAYLISQNGTSRQIDLGHQTEFRIVDLKAGTHVLFIQPFNLRGSVREVMVKSGEETSLGQIYSPCDDPENDFCDGIGQPVTIHELPLRSATPAKVPILTVCKALEKLNDPIYDPVIIVGHLAKSGSALILTGDCPKRLTTGSLVWPSAISLIHAAARAPHKHSRTDRDSSYYGQLVIPSGFLSVSCPAHPSCNGPHMSAIPAALMGASEKDKRAIR